MHSLAPFFGKLARKPPAAQRLALCALRGANELPQPAGCGQKDHLSTNIVSAEHSGSALALYLCDDTGLKQLAAQLPPAQAAWLKAHVFEAERGRVLNLPGSNGEVAGAIAGLGSGSAGEGAILWEAAALAERLPPATYRLATPLSTLGATQFTLGWLLGAYRFQRFKSVKKPATQARLVAPAGADLRYAHAACEAVSLGRDLVNLPANEMGPAELARAAQALSERFGGQCHIVAGAELEQGYPMVHAVGRASTAARAPRLVDCRFPRPGAPRVTLVGKGVCFDSGGLDLKPAAGMLLMKKDMGGAACALALAHLIRALDLPVQLRVLIPAVENSVGSEAFRPGDILRSRRGLTVEIGNTDAEGRLILADALSEADAESPDLLIDLATLTGAARTALGPDLPALYGSEQALVAELAALGQELSDPLWPMPLWAGYEEDFSSRVADINNMSSTPFAGSIIAALFLKRFVSAARPWLHVDLYAWNPKERPGRPLGGEVQAVRALYELIRRHYAAGAE
jgi:leucyl aminopeptidase